MPTLIRNIDFKTEVVIKEYQLIDPFHLYKGCNLHHFPFIYMFVISCVCMCLVNVFPYRNFSVGEVVYVVIMSPVLQIKPIFFSCHIQGIHFLSYTHKATCCIFIWFDYLFWCLLKDRQVVWWFPVSSPTLVTVRILWPNHGVYSNTMKRHRLTESLSLASTPSFLSCHSSSLSHVLM